MIWIKEKLQSALGFFGNIISFLLTVILCFFPLFVMDLPWWADFLIILVLSYLPLDILLWIAGLVVVITREQSALSVVYYVLFAINVLFVQVSNIIYLIKARNE